MECRVAILSEAGVYEFGEADFSMRTIFYNMDDERNINQLEIKRTARQIQTSLFTFHFMYQPLENLKPVRRLPMK